ncbi:type II toxin-antitoxin system HigB family toxin [Piscirickettsia salmonis]|uniref:type II toxin-antitoxin system HigB family toxin n=2 Tax=Piscirickettsia salmonis TaxID=1238 RepID=UPI003EBC31A2
MMRIISNKILRDFYMQPRYSDSKGAISAWYSDTKKADWSAPQDIKNVYANASFVANNRVVFNLGGNKYRLIGAINYDYKIVYVKFIGTHAQYDKVDAATVELRK